MNTYVKSALQREGLSAELSDIERTGSKSSNRSDTRKIADLANFVAMVGDLAVIGLGLLAGYWIRFNSGLIPVRSTWWTSEASGKTTISDYVGLMAMGALLLWLSFFYYRLYSTSNLLRFRKVILIIAKAASVWLFVYLGISLVLKFQPPISRHYVIASYVCTGLFLGLWRWALTRSLQSPNIAEGLRQNVIFVGWSAEANRVFNAIHADRSQPYRVVGYVPAPGLSVENVPPSISRLGSFQDLEQLLASDAADMVILGDVDPSRHEIVDLANTCEREHVHFKVIPNYFQILLSGLRLDSVSGIPILGVAQLPLDRIHNRILKRCVDIVGALVGLIASIPIIAICGAIVRWESPGPILYHQVRTGRRGTPFKIIKIRSMRLDAEANGAQWASKDDPRRLKIGSFMRRFNLDEVPQFWNVLKGDMSLVGPRPERPELIANFKHKIPHYNARHMAKPGITGWAQINGLRGDTDLAERVRFDLWYLENWSLWLDFQIMIQTFFRRDNAY